MVRMQTVHGRLQTLPTMICLTHNLESQLRAA